LFGIKNKFFCDSLELVLESYLELVFGSFKGNNGAHYIVELFGQLCETPRNYIIINLFIACLKLFQVILRDKNDVRTKIIRTNKQTSL